MAEWYLGSTKHSAITQWAATTAYSVGDIRRPTSINGWAYRCTTAGTSGGSQPTWGTTAGGTTNDGSVVWTEVTGQSAYGWNAAFYTFTGANTRRTPGDTIWVSHAHAETSSVGAYQIDGDDDSVSEAKAITRYVCVNDGAAPPTATATTASLTNTNGDIQIRGSFYFYGVNFIANGNVAFYEFTGSYPNQWTYLESCTLRLSSTGSGTPIIQLGSDAQYDHARKIRWKNVTVQFGHTGQEIHVGTTDFLWEDTPSAIVGATFPVTLFHGNNPGEGNATLLLKGVDLSALTSSQNLMYTEDNYIRATLVNCKLDTAVVRLAGTNRRGSNTLTIINSDENDTNYRYESYDINGSVLSETTVVKTGGSSDGTTAFSRKMESSSDATFVDPLTSDAILYWNDSTGSPLTITVDTVTDGVTLTDAEAWIEVEYLGSSGFPLQDTLTDRKTDYVATAANQTTSSATWTTTGLSSPVKQKLEVSVTPQERGLISVKVMLAKASTTMYYDPLILTASGRQYQTQQGVVNEAASSSGSVQIKRIGRGGLIA